MCRPRLTKMAAPIVECGDFLEFQDTLQKMREIDDKIIYMLNTTVPTESFKGQTNPVTKCKELFEEIQTGHSQREVAIKKCLNASKERVKQLKDKKNSGQEDITLIKNLKKEQNILRLLQSELNVEEVVRKRTIDIYRERCRRFYKPLNINSE